MTSGRPDHDQPSSESNVAPATREVRLVGSCAVRLWNSSPADRLTRAFLKAGAKTVVHGPAPAPTSPHVVVVRSDAVLDAPVVEALLHADRVILIGSDGYPLAAAAPAETAPAVEAWLEEASSVEERPRELQVVRPEQLCATYWSKLRKRETPYAMKATADRRAAIEWRMFMGTYKGATDLVTKWLWPVPAFWLTKLCVRAGVSPNMVTFGSFCLVVLAYFLFLDGQYAAGLAAGWLMTLLDTVDGKLARVTLTSSRFGHVFDHGIDLVHPPFWYLAWGWGLQSAGTPLPEHVLTMTLAIIVGGYVVLRILEGLFKLLYKMYVHVWRRFDTWFRLIVSRRNPNLILLTIGTAAGRPDLALIAVAAWTVASIAVHLVQFAQALDQAGWRGELRSWLAQGGDAS